METNLDLTKRVMQLLTEVPRSLVGLPTTRADIEAILAKVGCPLTLPIIPFQLEYGGYIYDIGYLSKIHLGIWSEPFFDTIINQWVCVFARFVPDTAPEELVMDEKGAIYWNAIMIPIASSIQLYLKSAAMFSWLDEQMHIQYRIGKSATLEIRITDISVLQTRLSEYGLNSVEEASDDYEQWWIDDRSALHIYKIWGTDFSTSGVTLYGDSVERLKELGSAFEGLADFPPESAISRIPKKIPPQ